MAAVLDRVPVDEIRAEARQIRFSRTVLTLFAAVFFVLGWLAAKTWGVFAWTVAAVKVGWLVARRPDGGG